MRRMIGGRPSWTRRNSISQGEGAEGAGRDGARTQETTNERKNRRASNGGGAATPLAKNWSTSTRPLERPKPAAAAAVTREEGEQNQDFTNLGKHCMGVEMATALATAVTKERGTRMTPQQLGARRERASGAGGVTAAGGWRFRSRRTRSTAARG